MLLRKTLLPVSHGHFRNICSRKRQHGDCCAVEYGEMAPGREWLTERLNSLLKDMRQQLASAPHNSTSQDQPAPFVASIYQTRWDADRIRFKKEETFSIPVSRLYISAQQHRQMQIRCGGSPLSVTSRVSAGHKEYEEDDSDLEGDSLMGPGQQRKVPTNPWDTVALALELTTSSAEGSPRSEKDKELDVVESSGDRIQSSNLCAFESKGPQCSARSTISTRRPFSLVSTNPTLSLYQGLSSYSGSRDSLLHPLRPCPLQHLSTIWKQESVGEQEEQEDVLGKKSTGVGRRQQTEMNEELWPNESCPDAACFSPSWQPKHRQAFAVIRIPDDVVRWAARYLLRTAPPEDTSFTTIRG